MSYGVARALLPRVRGAAGRGGQRDRAGRRGRQRVRRRQPARVPGLAAARAHRRRRRPPPDFRSSFFSNVNAAIDLSAPGEAIMTAVPPALDADGVQDGYSARAAPASPRRWWPPPSPGCARRAPDLTADQVGQAVRLSAVDHDAPGWQPDTGFGVLNVAAALAARSRRRPIPPSPTTTSCGSTGARFGKPDRLIFKGGKTRRLGAIIDVFEDPADVYRIRLRPRSRVRISADPVAHDDVDLRVYSRKAKSLSAKPLAALGPPRQPDRADHAAQPLAPRARVLRRGPRAARRARPRRRLRAARRLSSHRRPLLLGEVAGALERGRGRDRAGCRAGTTRRRARPCSPVPAAVTACRYVWSTRSPAAKKPGTLVRVDLPSVTT